MVDVTSVANMRNSENNLIANGVLLKDLMFKAGKAVFDAVLWQPPVAVVCGKGNNAGDGFVLASLLQKAGMCVEVFIVENKFSSDGKYYANVCKKLGIKFNDIKKITNLAEFNTVVDCVFGTGFKGEIRGDYLTAINVINSSKAQIISVDINSGLNGDNGLAANTQGNENRAIARNITQKVCVKSNLTVSIGSYKSGHFLNMAKDVIKDKLNVDIEIPLIEKPYKLIEKADVKSFLKVRDNYSNKSTYGYTAIIGGSKKFSGAAKLANLASVALRSGTGVIKLAVPNCIANGVMTYLLESTLFTLSNNDNGEIEFNKNEIDELLLGVKAVAIGMGIGLLDSVKDIIAYITSSYHGTLIIDADGLTAFSRIDKSTIKNSSCKIVLTPHVKEFSRITNLSVEEILLNPIKSAYDYAKEFGVIVLLKGPTTIITDGKEVYLTDTGCAGMATAGSGDVLSGIVTAFCGCADENLLLAVGCSAYVNGLAGQIAQEENGAVSMTAGDTANTIKNAILQITKS